MSARPTLVLWVFLGLSVCLIATVNCGDGATVLPSVAWRGTAGNALLIDQNGNNNTPPSQLWVGFNSAADFQLLLNTPPTTQHIVVEGTVVADSTQPLGFFLDPQSTFLPGGIVPELIQPMRTVSENLNVWSGRSVAFMVKVQQTN